MPWRWVQVLEIATGVVHAVRERTVACNTRWLVANYRECVAKTLKRLEKANSGSRGGSRVGYVDGEYCRLPEYTPKSEGNTPINHYRDGLRSVCAGFDERGNTVRV
jgi:hypothetical protein